MTRAGTDRARRLRRDMTDAERRLWRHIRLRQVAGARFRRQAPVGASIVDFACFERRLVVEVDGGQHADPANRDAARTAWLESQGFRVLRFWNNEVLENIEGVVETIRAALGASDRYRDRHPHPDPPPSRGRE